MKYSGLDALLLNDPQAQAYFNALPDYVQSQIVTRSGHVSLVRLKDSAENLTRGDN